MSKLGITAGLAVGGCLLMALAGCSSSNHQAPEPQSATALLALAISDATSRGWGDAQALTGYFARTTRQGTASSTDDGGGPATLYVSTSSHPLPVEFDTTLSQSTEHVVFSRWGHSVSLPTPSKAVPIDSIGNP